MCYTLLMRKQCQQCGKGFYSNCHPLGDNAECCNECCNGKDALDCGGCQEPKNRDEK